MQQIRTFISINLNNELKRTVSEIQKEARDRIINISGSYDSCIKWEKENNFHLTLFFTGGVSSQKLTEIESRLSEIKRKLSFSEMRFVSDGLSAFPDLRNPKVLVIKLVSIDKNVFILTDEINSAMKNSGIENDKKFIPHITIARIRRDRKINLADLKDKVKFVFEFKSDDFNLMKSELSDRGSEYSVLNKFKIQE